MMVKAGLGIGLLGSVHVLEPSVLPLDLDCAIAVPLYLTALTERLQSKPVRVVFDFVTSILGEGNPWLAREMDLRAEDAMIKEGYSMLFNI
jgi:hypothetical protein